MGKPRAELLKGTLDLLILKALTLGPKHGYGVARWLEDVSGDLLRIEEGSLYPALYRLEGRGLIQSHWGQSEAKRRVRLYSLTQEGREHLTQEVGGWERLVEAVTLVLGSQPESAGSA